jgi:hypothetical protein
MGYMLRIQTPDSERPKLTVVKGLTAAVAFLNVASERMPKGTTVTVVTQACEMMSDAEKALFDAEAARLGLSKDAHEAHSVG